MLSKYLKKIAKFIIKSDFINEKYFDYLVQLKGNNYSDKEARKILDQVFSSKITSEQIKYLIKYLIKRQEDKKEILGLLNAYHLEKHFFTKEELNQFKKLLRDLVKSFLKTKEEKENFKKWVPAEITTKNIELIVEKVKQFLAENTSESLVNQLIENYETTNLYSLEGESEFLLHKEKLKDTNYNKVIENIKEFLQSKKEEQIFVIKFGVPIENYVLRIKKEKTGIVISFDTHSSYHQTMKTETKYRKEEYTINDQHRIMDRLTYIIHALRNFANIKQIDISFFKEKFPTNIKEWEEHEKDLNFDYKNSIKFTKEMIDG